MLAKFAVIKPKGYENHLALNNSLKKSLILLQNGKFVTQVVLIIHERMRAWLETILTFLSLMVKGDRPPRKAHDLTSSCDLIL
jgi:hypothetical protein